MEVLTGKRVNLLNSSGNKKHTNILGFSWVSRGSFLFFIHRYPVPFSGLGYQKGQEG